MLKNILNLKGAQSLGKNEQQAIQGGKALCYKGCTNQSSGELCYTSNTACGSPFTGRCGNSGGSLECIPF